MVKDGSAEPFEASEEEFEEIFSMPGVSAVDTLDLRIGFLLHDVSRLRRSAFDQLMKPLGVTRSQWWVVAHISRNEGIMQRELATLLDIGKVTLGAIIDRLEASGLIERQSNPDDRRVWQIYLAPAAHDLIREMRKAEKKLNRTVLKGFSPEERAALAEMLGRVKRNLRRD